MIELDSGLERVLFAAAEGADKSAEVLLDYVKSEIESLGAVDTGRLLASAEKRENSVAVSAPYAGYVEYGTSRMEAKPFMALAILDAAQESAEIICAAVSEALR